MKLHLQNIKPLLKKNAYLAYVIGDQASYLQVHIPSAAILSTIADELGFEIIRIQRWRTRKPTLTKRTIDENILLMKYVE